MVFKVYWIFCDLGSVDQVVGGGGEVGVYEFVFMVWN